jgi:uncharacterized membrane protein YukC
MPRIRKQHDYATVAGIGLIVLGVLVIGGITYTYMTRPTLIEAAQKRVLDIRQVFEDFFLR